MPDQKIQLAKIGFSKLLRECFILRAVMVYGIVLVSEEGNNRSLSHDSVT